jgi:hypothetical protein
MRVIFNFFTFVATILLAVSPSSSSVYLRWSIGMEREVTEGVYMKLVSVSDGWRIWRIETRNDVDCRAIKSAIGRPHPIPAGAGAVFMLGTPFLMIMKGYQSPHSFSWNTTYWGDVEGQYRLVEEKFWSPLKERSDDLSQFDGKTLEISLTSYEYPAVNVGFAKETGRIDLKGMGTAIAAIDQCNLEGQRQ